MLIRLQQGRWARDIDTSILNTISLRNDMLLFPSQDEWNGKFFCENSNYASLIYQAILSAWRAGAMSITIRHELGSEMVCIGSSTK